MNLQLPPVNDCFLNFTFLSIDFSFVPESPRWLLSAGKVQKAKTILNGLGRFNGSKIHPVVLRRKSCDGCKIDNTSFVDSHTKEPGISDQQTTKEAQLDKLTTVSLQVAQNTMEQNMATMGETIRPKTTKSSTYLYLFKTRRMCLVTIILTVTW